MNKKQTGQENNTKVTSLDIFRRLTIVLNDTRTNHPNKYRLNTFLAIISIYVFFCTTFNMYFIPSFFDESITFRINYILKWLSYAYLAWLMLYLFLSACSIRKDLFKFGVYLITVGLLLLSIVSFYMGITGTTNLKSINISEFFSYVAATGAFASAIFAFTGQKSAEMRSEKNEKESQNRYREDSERTIFFQLLQLHTKKVESVIYDEDEVKETGYAAFKQYVEKANDYFILHLLTNNICSLSRENNDYAYDNNVATEKEIEEKYPNAYLEIKSTYCIYNIDDLKKKIEKDLYHYSIKGRQLIRNIYDPKMIDYLCTGEEILNWFEEILAKIFDENIISPAYIADRIKYVYDVVYKENGHFFGNYFLNLYSILDTIDNFRCSVKQKNYYAELFRAQLSRYEIALAVYHSVSDQSNDRTVNLLKKYNILNGLYYDDLAFTRRKDNNDIFDEKSRINYKQQIVMDIIESYWDCQKQPISTI